MFNTTWLSYISNHCFQENPFGWVLIMGCGSIITGLFIFLFWVYSNKREEIMSLEQQLILALAALFIPLFITLGAIAYDMNKRSKKEKRS